MGSAFYLLCPGYSGTLSNPLPIRLLGYGKHLPLPSFTKRKNICNFFLVPYRCVTGGDFRFILCPIVRPSAKSGSCDNLKTVWSLLMKLGKWTDGKVEIMHVLFFYSPL